VTTNDDVWGGLQPGATLTIRPLHSQHVLSGRLLDTPGRGSVPPRARVAPAAALSAAGEPVWVVSRSPQDGSLVLLKAQARGVVRRPGEVEFSQVVRLADESRRAALRAATQCPALLIRPGRTSRGTRTIDLSAQGCRVGVPEGSYCSVGQAVHIALDVDAGQTVWADGVVVWVDERRREAALRFTRIADADAERLDRRVLAALTAACGDAG
jgi:hypothetical protein